MYLENGHKVMNYKNVEKVLNKHKAFFRNVAYFMEDYIMNLENGQVRTNQELLEPFMMWPPFMPLDQFSYNYQQ